MTTSVMSVASRTGSVRRRRARVAALASSNQLRMSPTHVGRIAVASGEPAAGASFASDTVGASDDAAATGGSAVRALRISRRLSATATTMPTTITGHERPRRPPAERHQPETAPGRRPRRPTAARAGAAAPHPPVDRRVLGALVRDGGPGQQVGQDAGAAEEGRGREQHAEQDGVDAEVLAEAARDAGGDAAGTGAPQQPPRRAGV